IACAACELAAEPTATEVAAADEVATVRIGEEEPSAYGSGEPPLEDDGMGGTTLSRFSPAVMAAAVNGLDAAQASARPGPLGMDDVLPSMRERAGLQGGVGFLTEERLAPRVLSAQNAWLMTDILHDVTGGGTARRTRALGRNDLAGKTGTTNDGR